MLEEKTLVAGILFVIAAFSDLLDGYLARKWDAISNFGKLADPIADKIMSISALLILYILGRLHYAFIIVLAVKEILMITGGAVLYFKKIVVYAVWFGKLATLILNCSIAVILFFDLSNIFVNVLVGFAMFVEIAALLMYIRRYFELKSLAEPGDAAD
jgi:cardiolipin synthase